ncbi:carboxymuconolactone decarboxylase family protein [Nocardia brasiliensis]|uniref:Carboxymuconolactone decarboxylase n=1 Tax=Nocardia brasiliensis (strain ATCC 700358 / HUJEG-1) TaxID=1133849 RepID=K0ES36_NOCB7|nr:carboxymuconolactone decarboxylase family protein [Nocardia brasiliensis]AFU02623.1 carboxymuconolactone decarboxylase [Nocardia brasiliensis ATCC 700358]OCF84750.1 4-carboxymuconolactone decarboxylase [Nocardia brasiliensis]
MLDPVSAPEETTRDRLERGREILARICGTSGEEVLSALNEVSPALGHQIAAWAYGDIYSRPALDPRSRQLVTLGILAALGGCERELTVHAKAALTAGITPEELRETALHSAVYCGFPRAMEFMFTIKKVLAEHELSVK